MQKIIKNAEDWYLHKLQICTFIMQANYTTKHIFKGGQTLFREEKNVINYYKKNSCTNPQNESIILIRMKILLIKRILKIFS